MPADIHEHVRALQACNQRGGRMLSIVDLWEAGSVDLPLAAYLMAVMRRGASLLVGARPGGAGKTTVMCALLNLVPDEVRLQAVDSPDILKNALESPLLSAKGTHTCYVAHEIGAGSYYAYIWGQQAFAFFALAGMGKLVAANLHADTLHETRAQLCADDGTPQGLQNNVRPADLASVHLKLYLGVERGPGWRVRRYVRNVYENDRLLWAADGLGTFRRNGDSVLVTPEAEREAAVTLDAFRRHDVLRIEDVRLMLLRG